MGPQMQQDMFMSFYKIIFITALLLIGVISIVIIIALKKAKDDSEKQMDMQKEQTELLRECRDLLKGISDKKQNGTQQAENRIE